MDNPTKMYDNLKQLLVELQKVKDLNNLANEYKTISANLILSLQDYLKDGRAFSDSFSNYLSQTNKTVDETKNSLDRAISTMSATANTFHVADGTIDKKIESLSAMLGQLKQQAAMTEEICNNCMDLEKQVRKDTENIMAKVVDVFSSQSDAVSNTLKNNHKEISGQLKTVREDILAQNSQSVMELVNLMNSNEKSLKQNHIELTQRIRKLHSLLKVVTIVLVAIISIAFFWVIGKN